MVARRLQQGFADRKDGFSQRVPARWGYARKRAGEVPAAGFQGGQVEVGCGVGRWGTATAIGTMCIHVQVESTIVA